MTHSVRGVFLICPTHGHVYVHEDADMATAPVYSDLTPIYTDVPPPRETTPAACPFCSEPFIFEHGELIFEHILPIPRSIHANVSSVQGEVQSRPPDNEMQEVRAPGRDRGDGAEHDQALAEAGSQRVGTAQTSAEAGGQVEVILEPSPRYPTHDSPQARKDSERRKRLAVTALAISYSRVIHQSVEYGGVSDKYLAEEAEQFIEEWFDG
jgi:hypothetical protein